MQLSWSRQIHYTTPTKINPRLKSQLIIDFLQKTGSTTQENNLILHCIFPKGKILLLLLLMLLLHSLVLPSSINTGIFQVSEEILGFLLFITLFLIHARTPTMRLKPSNTNNNSKLSSQSYIQASCNHTLVLLCTGTYWRKLLY